MTREIWVIEQRIKYPATEEWHIDRADDRFTEKQAKKIVEAFNYQNAYAEYRAVPYVPKDDSAKPYQDPERGGKGE